MGEARTSTTLDWTTKENARHSMSHFHNASTSWTNKYVQRDHHSRGKIQLQSIERVVCLYINTIYFPDRVICDKLQREKKMTAKHGIFSEICWREITTGSFESRQLRLSWFQFIRQLIENTLVINDIHLTRRRRRNRRVLLLTTAIDRANKHTERILEFQWDSLLLEALVILFNKKRNHPNRNRLAIGRWNAVSDRLVKDLRNVWLRQIFNVRIVWDNIF